MPLYEYFCATCGGLFEKMMPFSAHEQKPECPTCHSKETHKQLSLVASRSTGGSSAGTPGSSCRSSSSPFR